MRQQVFITTADVPPEALWRVIADVPNWPAWDPEIESVRPAYGRTFLVKRRGNSAIRLRVDDKGAPHRFAYTCKSLLARMRILYNFEPTRHGCLLRVTIQVRGLFAWGWQWLHADKLGAWLSERTRRLVRKARELCACEDSPNRTEANWRNPATEEPAHSAPEGTFFGQAGCPTGSRLSL